MLKAVLSAIPTYFMSIFQMPVGVRQRLESDPGFFLARIPSGGGKRDGVGEMGDRLSSGFSRQTRRSVFATYQLGVIDQVGGPPAPAVRGSIVGATPSLLRSLDRLAQVADPTERRLCIHVLPSSSFRSSAGPFSSQAGLRDILSVRQDGWTWQPIVASGHRRDQRTRCS